MDIEKSVIGIVGLGLMGHGIASNIQKHGYQVVFVEHAGNQPSDELLKKGAKSVNTLEQLAAECHIIIICVTGSAEVEQVVFSEQGILQTIKPGSIVIDCSTSMPDSTLKIDQAFDRVGVRFMDAPMTRTPKEAAQGRLNLIVGADDELFQSMLPLLNSFAENITLAGPVGCGHQMKLLHNYVSLGFSALLSEATACARGIGIADDVFIEVLANGGGAGVILERLKPFIQNNDDSAFLFSMANALKDMRYYVDMASQSNTAKTIAASVRDVYADAEENTGPQAPVPTLINFISNKNQ